jgi:hypothetical protein
VFLLKNNQKIMKTKLRGAVLLLVLTVMFMLMILLMATLAMVSSSNQKAYVKFEENQAFYSAVSALEVFWNGALSDSAFLASDSGGALKNYYKEDGTPAANTLTQGRELELELYKLAPLSPLGGISAAQLNSKINGGTADDLVSFFSATVDENDFSTYPDYGKQFNMEGTGITNAPKEVAFFVEYPAVTSPTDGGFGRYADVNPNYASGKAPQVATIKIEVLDRYYDIAGVDKASLINFLQDTDTDPTTNPVPAAIAHPTIADKIDNTLLTPTLHQSGDRTKDQFDIRITAESMLMGVKGSAAVEMKSSAPVVTLPAADTAIKSFGFTEDGAAGYNAVGGASGLADMKIEVGDVSGIVYSEGNIYFGATGSVIAEDSMEYKSGANGDYIVSKPHMYSKSWISNPNSPANTSQGTEMFFYAARGFNLKKPLGAAGKPEHYITNGDLIYSESMTLNGNVVVGRYGNLASNNTGNSLTINKSMYVHDFYLDDLDASGVALGANSFGMNPDRITVGEGTIYVRDLYLNFPASAVSNPASVSLDAATGLEDSTPAPTAANVGFYDNNRNDITDADVSPINIAGGAKWPINTGFDMAGTKLVVSGQVYFRDYAANSWVGRDWEDIDGSGTDLTDWFVFLDGTVGGTPSAGGVFNPTTANITYQSQTTPGGAYVLDQEYAWDINPDVSDAINSRGVTYNSYLAGETYSEDPQIAAGVNLATGDPSKAPFSFDVDSGHVWLRMPFKVSDGTHTERAIIKFDTPMSLYKEFFIAGTAVFNTGTQPEDGDDNRYMTNDPSLASNPDVLGYGMLTNAYVGPFTYTAAAVGRGTYALPTSTPRINDAAQNRSSGTQHFGYILDEPVSGGDGTSTYGIKTLVVSSEDKVGATAWGTTGYVFDANIANVESTSPAAETMFIISPSRTVTVKQMAAINSDGVSRIIQGGDYQNAVNNLSPLVVIDATTVGKTVVLDNTYESRVWDNSIPPWGGWANVTVTSSEIIGTYIVVGNNPVNFIIKDNAAGTEQTINLGANNGSRTFNIISADRLANLRLTQGSGNDSGHYGYGLTAVPTEDLKILTGANAANYATSTLPVAEASNITLYVGKNTNLHLESGIVDGTIYAPFSKISFAAGNAPELAAQFNSDTPAAKSPTAVLGTIVCGTLKWSNEQKVIFLSNAGAPSNPPGLPHFAWSPLVYTANAAGS